LEAISAISPSEGASVGVGSGARGVPKSKSPESESDSETSEEESESLLEKGILRPGARRVSLGDLRGVWTLNKLFVFFAAAA
jgi:hypothetical protein